MAVLIDKVPICIYLLFILFWSQKPRCLGIWEVGVCVGTALLSWAMWREKPLNEAVFWWHSHQHDFVLKEQASWSLCVVQSANLWGEGSKGFYASYLLATYRMMVSRQVWWYKKNNPMRKAKSIYIELDTAKESATVTCILGESERLAEKWKSFLVVERDVFMSWLKAISWGHGSGAN